MPSKANRVAHGLAQFALFFVMSFFDGYAVLLILFMMFLLRYSCFVIITKSFPCNADACFKKKKEKKRRRQYLIIVDGVATYMSSLYGCFHIWGAFTESCLAWLLAHALLLAYAFNFLPFDHIANGQLLPFPTFNGTRFNLQHDVEEDHMGKPCQALLAKSLYIYYMDNILFI